MELATDPLLLSASSTSLNRLSTRPAPSETSPRALLSYTIRFLSCLLTMELLLHSMYVVALKDSGKGWWNGMTPAEVSMVGFWNLIVVWLKVRLRRPHPACVQLTGRARAAPTALASLPPLGAAGRHRPAREHDPLHGEQLFDARILAELAPQLQHVGGQVRSLPLLPSRRPTLMTLNRYLYIPLGGSARPLLATLGVFTFVALWHDLRLRLLIWGWGVTLFVVPEMIARKAVPYSKVRRNLPVSRG